MTQARNRHQHGGGDGEDRRLVRLRELEPGQSGTIDRLSCRRQLRRRLMDMGVVAGTPVRVERVAPLGDPMELNLKGFHLSLRKEEAGDIWVEVPADGC
ncbi:MAG: FeoA family protein [Actinomycetota bacterium]